MSEKFVTIEVKVYLSGNYYSINEAPKVIRGWLDSALEDRQDVEEWTIGTIDLVEDNKNVELPDAD